MKVERQSKRVEKERDNRQGGGEEGRWGGTEGRGEKDGRI